VVTSDVVCEVARKENHGCSRMIMKVVVGTINRVAPLLQLDPNRRNSLSLSLADPLPTHSHPPNLLPSLAHGFSFRSAEGWKCIPTIILLILCLNGCKVFDGRHSLRWVLLSKRIYSAVLIVLSWIDIGHNYYYHAIWEKCMCMGREGCGQHAVP
jgi:hypothetical protein